MSPARIPAAASTQVAQDPSSTAATQNSDADEELSRDAGIMGGTLRKSLRTTAMDIARKSIMQHAAASPRKAFLKVSEVAARSHGEPSLHDLLAASETDDNDYSGPSRPVKPVATQSFAHPDTPFTFESTPLPPFNPTTTPQEPNIQLDFEASDKGSSTRAGHITVEETDYLQPLHDGNSLESSFHARASMANKAAPYRVLSVNEREALRSSRGPGFRARPVDPKLFTNAGETGIPKVVKAPLTIPISPVFSKRVRTKAVVAPTTTTTTKSSLRKGPVRTAAFQRLVNITKPGLKKDTGSRYQASGSNVDRRLPDADKDAPPRSSGIALKSSSLHERSNSGTEHPVEPQTASSAPNASDSSKAHVQGSTTTLYPPTTTDQQPRGIGSSSIFRPPATTAPRATTLGPPLRGDGPSTTSAHATFAPVSGRKAVTHPVPFSFATDKLRHDGHGTVAAAATTASAYGQTIARPATVKYTAPTTVHSQKPVTHPVPFKFATDKLRRGGHGHGHGHGHGAAVTPATAAATEHSTIPRHTAAPTLHSRRPLTHPIPFKFATDDILRRRHVMFQSRGASTSAASTNSSAATAKEKPKPVNAGVFKRAQPLKRLTIPVPFHLATQRRAEVRPPIARPMQTLETATSASIRTPPRRSRLTGVFPEREQRMRMRESMERTFKARPITHYQPTVIHKATRALTKPVSPMIGEKRKRYEMEQQFLEQQRQEEEYEHNQQQQEQQLGYSQGQRNETYHGTDAISSPTSGSVPDYEVYRSFEEAKILQAQQQALQQQLTAQERRQVVLANSSRATIHQPPIRLSFPMDPETEALQVDDTPRHTHDHEEDANDYEAPASHQLASSSSATATAGRKYCSFVGYCASIDYDSHNDNASSNVVSGSGTIYSTGSYTHTPASKTHSRCSHILDYDFSKDSPTVDDL
ncbi:hypothetical protein BGW39_001214 [Mortierella sp. 14UC]|nr:hypothetical protein BGW39_001214 [Mortierella sp. 14UC]